MDVDRHPPKCTHGLALTQLPAAALDTLRHDCEADLAALEAAYHVAARRESKRQATPYPSRS